LNVKYLDGLVEVENRDTGERHRVAFSGPLPLLYARTEVRLPGTGFYAGGEGSYLAFEGHRVLDVSLGAGYRVGLGVAALGLEGGWKRQRLRLDDFDGLDADLTIEGPYMGISAHF
jgi:outer membrane protein